MKDSRWFKSENAQGLKKLAIKIRPFQILHNASPLLHNLTSFQGSKNIFGINVRHAFVKANELSIVWWKTKTSKTIIP